MKSNVTTTDLFIRRAYTHKGISVVVEIDLAAKEISLVQLEFENQYAPAKWVFAGRTLKYMAGWQNILDAMKLAIAEATKELEAEEARGNKKMAELLMALASPRLEEEQMNRVKK